MLRLQYLCVVFCLFYGFKTTSPTVEESSYQVKLINELGTIKLSLPPHYDFFHSWNRSDDYDCGDQKFYRFQSSKYSKKQESGYFAIPPDTIYALTIKHHLHKDCLEGFPERELSPAEILTQTRNYLKKFKYPIEPDTLFYGEINGNGYVIYYLSEKFLDSPNHFEVVARTLGQKIPLQFEFIKYNSEISENDFFDESLKILESVEFDLN